MKKNLLSKIKSANFLNLKKIRDKIIKKAPAKVREDHFNANLLSKSLHPNSLVLKVVEIVEISKDIKKFVFTSNQGVYFPAGSYLSIQVKINGVTTIRPYSISSSPLEGLNGHFEIIIKRKPNGLVSNFFLNQVKVNDTFKALAPDGQFTYESLRDAPNVIAIAGGSGITPFLSMAKSIKEGSLNFHLSILYGVNKEEDLMEKEELDLLASHPQIEVKYLLKDEIKDGFLTGVVTKDLIESMIQSKQTSFFLCGPNGMYDAMLKILNELMIPSRLIRLESNGTFKNQKTNKIHQLTIHHGENLITIEASEDETILTSIEKAGLAVPSKCRVGQCGFCTAKVLKGLYETTLTDKRRMKEVDYDYIHTCSTYPLSDMEIIVSKLNL